LIASQNAPLPSHLSRIPVAGWLVLLSLTVLLIYWPGLSGGFVFDDFPNIVDNVALHVTSRSNGLQWLAAIFSSPASDWQRPLAMLSFAINHALSGLDPYWMKATNLGIHLLNTWLVFAVVRRLLGMTNSAQTGADRVSLWIAAAWALHPINLMGVLFIVQRMESLSHTFVFAGLWLYLLGRQRLRSNGRGWALMLGGLIGGTALGMLAKESATLLPLYALAIEWAFLHFSGRNETPDRRLQTFFAAVLLLPGLAALAWQLPKVLQVGAYAGRAFTLSQRLLTEARVLVDYIHWTLIPNLNTLSLYHDDYVVSLGLLSPPSTLLSLVILVALLATTVWLRRRRPLIALGLAWFFIAHLLTATILPLELVYEHRNYFASLGLCLMMADVFLRWPVAEQNQRIGWCIALALLAFYAGLTALRAREWQDQLRFSVSEAAKHPHSPRATYDVARTYIIISRYDPTSPYISPARVALEKAMQAPNASTLPEAAAIMFAARIGTPIQDSWWQRLQEKLRNEPIGPQQTSSLASLVDCDMHHLCQLPPRQMMTTFLSAMAHGGNAEVMNIYGNYALNVLRDPTLALNLWQAAAQRAPTVVQYQVTLAKMLIAVGQPEQAQVPIARLRRLGRFGQTVQVANELDRLAGDARKAPPPPSLAPKQ
jgi:hypothetical protein